MNVEIVKTYLAGGTLTPRQIVKFGADDRTVVASAAAADKHVGVTTDLGASSGERVDIAHTGIAWIKAGGTVTRGDFVTSDANGAAVSAAPAAGVNNRIIGIALSDAVVGDFFDVALEPGSVQG